MIVNGELEAPVIDHSPLTIDERDDKRTES